MASLKFRLDTRRADKKGLYPLKLIVYHNQKNVAINLDISLKENEWTDEGQAITRKHLNFRELNDDLNIIYGEYTKIIKELTQSGKIIILSAADLKDRLINHDSDYYSKATFTNYIDSFIKTTKLKNQTYIYTKATIDKYTDGKTLLFEDINISWLNKFADYMTTANLAINTQFTILKSIRSIFNRAIDEDIVGQEVYPFRKFKIKTERTAKRSLTVDELRTLRDYPCQEYQVRYRDMFMLVFYLIGINAVDLLNLVGIKDGRVEFKRAKTGRHYSIKVEPEAMDIIERYKGIEYLLNILDTYGNYKNFLSRTNNTLQKIGDLTWVDNGAKDKSKKKKNKKQITPLFPDITTYWARHTWATIAADIDVPDAVISLALGHATQNSTTEIYIKRNQRKIDKANRDVIDFIQTSESAEQYLNRLTEEAAERAVKSRHVETKTD